MTFYNLKYINTMYLMFSAKYINMYTYQVFESVRRLDYIIRNASWELLLSRFCIRIVGNVVSCIEKKQQNDLWLEQKISSHHNPRAHGKSVLKGLYITAQIYFSVEKIIRILTSGISWLSSVPEGVPKQNKSEWFS